MGCPGKRNAINAVLTQTGPEVARRIPGFLQGDNNKQGK